MQYCCRSSSKKISLTLASDTRFCYQSIHLFQGNWKGLQERCRPQFSKIGKTSGQLSHACRSFCYNEIAEMIDAFVQNIQQVAEMLNYGESAFLEVFKNMLPS